MTAKGKTEAVPVTEARFTKSQLKSSKRYRADTDILSVVLEEDKSYTLAETDSLIKEFKERRMK